MLHFQTWKITVIALICAFGVIFSLPNLVPASTLDRLPSWLPKHQLNLGLDLRGGSHLLYEVDFTKALHDRLDSLEDGVRAALQKARSAGLKSEMLHPLEKVAFQKVTAELESR